MRSVDLIALDREDRPFLLVEAQRRPVSPTTERSILHDLASAREALPYGGRIHFGLIADPESMRLYELDRDEPSPLGSWATNDILGHYDPGFPERVRSLSGIHPDSIAGLIGSWLRDIAYHWKSPSPPGTEQWEAAGLLGRIAEGSTLSEVRLGFDALR